MAFGIFGKFFTNMRSSSQPPTGSVGKKATKSNELKRKNLNSKSTPSLGSSSQKTSSTASNKSAEKKKALKAAASQGGTGGQKTKAGPSQKTVTAQQTMMPTSIDSDEKDSDNETTTNYSQKSKSTTYNDYSRTSRQQQNSETLVTSRLTTQSKQTAGYESSEESSEEKSTTKVTDFISSLDKNESVAGTSMNTTEPTQKSFSLAQKIRESQLTPKKSSQQPVMTSTKKLSASANQDKSFGQVDPLNTGYTVNKSNTFSQSVVTFREPESTMINSGLNMTKQSNMVTTETIQRLAANMNLEKNDITKLIDDNKQLELRIEELQTKLLDQKNKDKQEIDRLLAKFYDSTADNADKEELKMLFVSEQQEHNEKLINEQERAIKMLKFKCKRLETELSKTNETSNIKEIKELKQEAYELKNIIQRLNVELSVYQAKYPNMKKETESSLLNQNQASQVSTRFMASLVKEYDLRLNEKDEQLRQFKIKIDDLTSKFQVLANENSTIHMKHDNKLEQIKDVANLVLLENENLKEELNLKEKYLKDIEKNHMKEIARLSKRLIVCESERLLMQNQLDLYQENHDIMLGKYNESSVEVMKRITLEEHLNQIGDLRRQIEEINLHHRQELENAILSLQSSQNEKKDLAFKYSQLLGENKKLEAENKVMEKAIDEQIGKKVQKKIQNLQRKLELAELKEKTAYACLEQINIEAEKIKIEKETFSNLAKVNETEAHKIENKLMEESIKNSRLEEKLNQFKEKAATKLANMIEKMQKKDAELILTKLENEKKISKVVDAVNNKQTEIEMFIKEKKNIEEQLDSVYDKTSSDNQKLKNILLEIKSGK